MMAATRRQLLGRAAATSAAVLFEPFSGLSRRAHATVKVTHAQAAELLNFLPLYVAQARGFFGDEGLDVGIYNAQQRTIALRAIVAGDAFSYSGDPAEPALARLRGVDVKNIGTLVNRAVSFLVGKTGTPKDPKQWKGKSILVPRPPNTAVNFVQMILQEAGYSQADKDGLVWKPGDSAGDGDHVRFQPVVMGSELAAMLAGQADLAHVVEPDTSNALSQGFEIVVDFAQRFGPFLLSSIAVMNRTIQEQPDLVQRFVNAMTKACVFGHKYPDQAAAVAVQRYYTSDATIMAEAAKRLIAIGAFPNSLVISREAYSNNFDKLLSHTAHQAAKFPFEELVDGRFAENAAGQSWKL
jgi:NitT/TauT family transport system substrate-binding protein